MKVSKMTVTQHQPKNTLSQWPNMLIPASTGAFKPTNTNTIAETTAVKMAAHHMNLIFLSIVVCFEMLLIVQSIAQVRYGFLAHNLMACCVGVGRRCSIIGNISRVAVLECDAVLVQFNQSAPHNVRDFPNLVIVVRQGISPIVYRESGIVYPLEDIESAKYDVGFRV